MTPRFFPIQFPERILRNLTPTLLTLSASALFALPAAAHDGRRFQVEVVDGRLQAQGVNTITNTGPDGVTVIDPSGPRAYTNALHGHFESLSTAYFSDLPGYDLGTGTEALAGSDLFLTVTGVSRWTGVSENLVAGTPFVAPGTVADFQPLEAGESIRVSFQNPVTSVSTTVDTANLSAGDTLEIVSDFDGDVAVDGNGIATNINSNGYDRDLTYELVGDGPRADTLYLLEATLSTNAVGIADSTPVFTILSPDGSGPVERLHFASLFAEAALGTPVTAVPEPGSVCGVARGGRSACCCVAAAPDAADRGRFGRDPATVRG